MKHKHEINEVRIDYVRPLYSTMKLITSAYDAVEVFRKFVGKRSLDVKEYFWAMFLTRSNRLLGITEVGCGDDSRIIVNIKEIFQLTLRYNASGIILCHNHPSGNLKPSDSDRSLTERITKVGEILNISVLDHIILTSEDFYSFQSGPRNPNKNFPNNKSED